MSIAGSTAREKIEKGFGMGQDDLSSSSTLWRRLLQEVRAVALWALLSVSFNGIIVLLGIMARYRNDDDHDDSSSSFVDSWENVMGLEESSSSSSSSSLPSSSLPVPSSWWKKGFYNGLARWILWMVPHKVLSSQAPGFIYANPWILLWIYNITGILPNIPTRICEYVMGRISLSEVSILLPLHIIATLSTMVFLRDILPDFFITRMLEPMEYSSNGWTNWMVVDFGREVIVTTIFTVAIMVLPVLFRMNHIPKWTFVIFMYPLFNFAVDTSGMASSFSPNAILTLNILFQRRSFFPLLGHLVAPMVGGLCGGNIMKKCFPDQKEGIHRKL